MKRKIRNRHAPLESPEQEAPQPRLADVIEEVSKLAVDPVEAALVINHLFSRRAIRFAADFNPRTLRVKLH